MKFRKLKHFAVRNFESDCTSFKFHGLHIRSNAQFAYHLIAILLQRVLALCDFWFWEKFAYAKTKYCIRQIFS